MARQRTPLAGLPCVPIFSSHWFGDLKLALIGVATLVAAASATPALAQAVIEDPGYCAQFYANANCQNLGPGNPYTDGGYFRNNWQNDYVSAECHWYQHHVKHRR